MKLVFGIPTAGHPAEPFLQSLHAMQLPPSITAFENKTATGNFVPAQRELIADYAFERDADFLMMVDDDMVVPPDGVARMLEPFRDPKVGLVGALCYSRDGLRPMAVTDWDPADTTGASIPAFDDRTPTPVDGIGFGMVLIRMETLGRMERPFFPVQVYIERSAARVRICNEDFLFCKRVRDQGELVMLHPGVRCGHYDRDSQKTYPLAWEQPEHTNFKRMMVQDAGGAIGMKLFDATVGRIEEKHRSAFLDYILVD